VNYQLISQRFLRTSFLLRIPYLPWRSLDLVRPIQNLGATNDLRRAAQSAALLKSFAQLALVVWVHSAIRAGVARSNRQDGKVRYFCGRKPHAKVAL
jgi:hypothetical protein